MEFKNFAAAMALICAPLAAAADEPYPSKPVTMLVGFAAGGPTDNVARIVSEELGKELGQTIVVENRPGANSQVAIQELTRKPADGYTIMLSSNGPLTFAPAVYSKLPYDVNADFSYIGGVAAYPHMLVVPASSAWQNIGELLEAAKQSPDGIFAASVGHVNDLTIEWIKSLSGAKISRIPYGGDAAVVSDLVSERVDMALLAPNVALPLIDAGKIRALALTTPAEVGQLEGIPTLADAGLEGFDVSIWNGIIAKSDVDPAIIAKINDALNRALAHEGLQERLAKSGQRPVPTSPEEFKNLVSSEGENWIKVAEEANLPKMD